MQAKRFYAWGLYCAFKILELEACHMRGPEDKEHHGKLARSSDLPIIGFLIRRALWIQIFLHPKRKTKE